MRVESIQLDETREMVGDPELLIASVTLPTKVEEEIIDDETEDDESETSVGGGVTLRGSFLIDEDGNVKVAEVHIPAFSTALGELIAEEFEIEGIKPIKFPEGLKLSPVEMGHMEEVVDMSTFLNDDEDE